MLTDLQPSSTTETFHPPADLGQGRIVQVSPMWPPDRMTADTASSLSLVCRLRSVVDAGLVERDLRVAQILREIEGREHGHT